MADKAPASARFRQAIQALLGHLADSVTIARNSRVAKEGNGALLSDSLGATGGSALSWINKWKHSDKDTQEFIDDLKLSPDMSPEEMMDRMKSGHYGDVFAKADEVAQNGGIDLNDSVYNQTDWRDAYQTAQDKAGVGTIDPAAQAMQDQQSRMEQIQGQLQKYADEMNMPLDQLLKTDQYAKASQQNALSASGQEALLGGSGGLAASGASKTMNDALVGYGMQRRQLGLQALGQMGGMASQAANNAQDWAKFQSGLDMQMQGMADQAGQQAFQARQGQAQGIGAAIGGGIGALGFLAGPEVGPLTMAGGSALGGGLGGMAAGSYSPYQYRRPKASSSRGAYGLGGGGNY